MKLSSIKRITSFLLIFTFVVSFLTPAIPGAKAAEVISVAEAIANNTGTATVEGYIVAHTTGTNSYNFLAPFSNDYNLAIADTPNETDPAKIFPVQLSSGFRTSFGLNTNPNIIGQKINVTGSLESYYSVPALKSPTSIVFVDGQGEPTPQPDPSTIITIEEARKLSNNTTVTIQGVITADNSAIGGGKLSTYIQDETAGINIYSSTSQDLKEGDLVKVTGTLAEYRGLKEIIPANAVEVLAQGQPLPQPKALTLSDLQSETIAEPLEGQLVKVTGYASSVPSSPAGGGYNISFIDAEFNSTTLRLMEGTNAISAIEEGKWYEVTAILSQYNTYQILPRKAEDIVLAAEQPEAPSAAGTYESKVLSVTDGDTIKLEIPVLGATTVRFVNIDTAETYHTPKNELDQNQLDHGIAAKEYMNTLLKAGDEVLVKVGEEATDAYGRVLGQVIRKSDGLNTNLEMVRSGNAVTYFIWPVGDEADYNLFQNAVKEAKDAELGIWNPANPLMELPFEFRAREQGKGLSRYVGNSDTKEYVLPDNFKDVPVEKRVFFADSNEAEANGYTAVGSQQPVEDPNGSEDNISLQLLSLNDLHGKIDQQYKLDTNGDGVEETVGRMDYVSAYLKQRDATNPNTLIVHAGDMIGGSSPVSALLQDEPTVEILEAIGFDFGTVGNHEFDEGTQELLRMVNGGEHPEGKGTIGYDGMNFPNLCANCMSKETNQPILPPYAVYEVEGVKVGFIGVNTVATANMVIPSGIQDIYFSDEVTAVNNAVAELQAQGVESIIVLSHMPASQDGASATGDAANLANEVNDAVDIIYAGHNHQIVNAVVDGKLIVQALDYGKAFADVDVEIDPTTKDIVKNSAEIVYVNQSGVTPDPEVEAILAKYAAQTAEIMNEVVGISEGELKGGYASKGLVGDNALGNLIADGMAWAMQSDFALMNGGGIRDDINAGEITWSELFNVQPFGNTLVKVEITGADLEEIINAQFSSYGPDVSIGGFKYTWDGSTNKVVDLFLPDGSEIDRNATYTVTVNNYMYEHGRDKYKLRLLGENPVQGPIDLDATVDFIKSFNNEAITYIAEGRISQVIALSETNETVTLPEGGMIDFSGATFTNNEPVTVTLEPVSTDSLDFTNGAYSIGGMILDIHVSDTFTGAVTLKFPYDPSMGTIENLGIYHYNNGVWEYQQTKLEDGFLIAKVSHFSIYGVLKKNDMEAPSTVYSLPEADLSTGSFIDHVKVNLSASDNLTEVSKTEYTLNDVEWFIYEADKGILIDEEGTTKVTFKSTDLVGNVEELQSVTVTIVKPTIDNVKLFVQEAEANKGMKTSTLAKLRKVERTQGEKAYKELEKVEKHLKQMNNRLINEADKEDILKLIEYILKHQTL
ncbi:2',3'-cyclic-nucleotide 2'-phosphodiesterase (5'-nucleotidase family)/endonuclease YncB(thermonuclease family) [Bacillus mesophilus]|uniref:Endonuclease n=1 Tax=Bacillus mesophilus TaxID=1808955 RepID=A0A6M0Q912_9BACI|nr:5'-nucleotidase C-terminal domain-containing protein [Bacillus mesophilus]MBM7662499.1 2',3'-cyclic-nucleotide 2'-phosphodiesterase (5'-nucleotidase family)/endonuclease YncB(thermonuclease family) [Bacillus mesophilus]NEY72876.1 endonuclease [Bacillus mesophilus]